MRRALLLILYALSTSAFAQPIAVPLPFVQQGAGAIPRALAGKCPEGKLCDDVSLKDFGAKCDGGVTDDTVAARAAIASAAVLGSRVFVPRGICKVSQLVIPAGVWLYGVSGFSAYSDTDINGMSALKCTTGDYCIALTGTGSSVTNLRLVGTGGTTAYGLVTAKERTHVENVAVVGFEYGFAVNNLNANVFRHISALSNTKAGFVALEANAGGVAAYEYPKLSSIMGTAASTLFLVDGFLFRTNGFGIIMRETFGRGVFQNGVIESNDKAGLVAFRSTGSYNNDVLFNGVWWENNNRSDDGVITGFEALKTSATEYLKGDVTGEWDTTGDRRFMIWLGSQTQATPPTGYRFFNNNLTSKYQALKSRESIDLQITQSYVQSALASTPLFSLNGTRSIRTMLNDITSFGDSAIDNMNIGGLRTSVISPRQPLTVTKLAVASSAYTDIFDPTAADIGNKYEYSISVDTAFESYGAQGYVFWNGNSGASGVQIVPYLTGGVAFNPSSTGAVVRIDPATGRLQYQQKSGVAKDITAIIRNLGQLQNN